MSTLITTTAGADRCCRGLGWRWIQWIMAILTFAAAIGLIVMLPETQYTRKTGQAPTKRQWIDDYRFWPVSGGGPPKQHRHVLTNP